MNSVFSPRLYITNINFLFKENLWCKKGVTTGLKLLAVLTRKTAAEKKNQIQGIKRDFRFFEKYRELKSFCPKIFLINVKKVD